MVKLTNDEFIKKAKLVHGSEYDYSETEYTLTKNKVKIICSKHGEFFQCAGNHLIGRGCPKCSLEKMTLSKDEFIFKSKKIHGDKYDYSKVVYSHNKNKVKIICSKHGEFFQCAGNHLIGRGCQKCAGLDRKDTESFIRESKKIHGDKYNYSKVDYVNTSGKVKIICKSHGVFEQLVSSHLRGHGCQKCAGLDKKDTESFIDCAKKLHTTQDGKPKYNYDKVEYTLSKNKVIITCPIHGDWKVKANNHLRKMGGGGCPYCFESRGELIIEKILYDLDINYVRQKKFEDCTNKLTGGSCRKLPFDFYLTNKKICIEYDGVQHYKPVKIFGGDKSFLRVKKNDKLKNIYCEQKGIKLIRIPYTMNDKNIKLYIIEKLGVK